LQTAATSELKPEVEETAVTNGTGDDNIDNVKDEEDTGGDDEDDVDAVEGSSVKDTVSVSTRVSDKLLQDVATRLTDTEWKQLALKINFQDDDIAYFESEHVTSTERALKMLTVWKASLETCSLLTN